MYYDTISIVLYCVVRSKWCCLNKRPLTKQSFPLSSVLQNTGDEDVTSGAIWSELSTKTLSIDIEQLQDWLSEALLWLKCARKHMLT